MILEASFSVLSNTLAFDMLCIESLIFRAVALPSCPYSVSPSASFSITVKLFISPDLRLFTDTTALPISFSIPAIAESYRVKVRSLLSKPNASNIMTNCAQSMLPVLSRSKRDMIFCALSLTFKVLSSSANSSSSKTCSSLHTWSKSCFALLIRLCRTSSSFIWNLKVSRHSGSCEPCTILDLRFTLFNSMVTKALDLTVVSSMGRCCPSSTFTLNTCRVLAVGGLQFISLANLASSSLVYSLCFFGTQFICLRLSFKVSRLHASGSSGRTPIGRLASLTVWKARSITFVTHRQSPLTSASELSIVASSYGQTSSLTCWSAS
mmetsp:Transcript_40965/g.95043  ORF Transcript_40965/g.95043 Transcript_40965/m.95043 type:complete len:322 (+) Transcript_40965:518-1483(+)